MADYYLKSGGGSIGSGSYRGIWSNSQTWAVGDRVVDTAYSGRVYECTTGGAGGASEPSWNTTTDGTTNSGSAVFTTRVPTTWANATIEIYRVSNIAAAGDNVFVSHNHAEVSSAPYPTFAGSVTNPTRVICADDTSGEPPTTKAETGSCGCTGSVNPVLAGAIYAYGVEFRASNTFANGSWRYGPGTGNVSVFEKCKFTMPWTNMQSIQPCGSLAATQVGSIWKNCDVSFAHASQYIGLGSGRLVWQGGSVISSSAPTVLFAFLAGQNQRSDVEVSGVDLSALSSSAVLVSGVGIGRIVFRDVKLPASWSGTLLSSNLSEMRVEMYNGDSGDTNYRLWVEDYYGSIKSETTLVRTGGASDGTTALSWKMASSAYALYWTPGLVSPEIMRWQDAVGSAVTVTVEILHDSATALNDDEVWVEVMGLNTSGVPLGSWTSDRKVMLASAAAQTSSSETWTTTGMTNPNKQKLSVTFTPQEKGYIVARVVLAKASKTIYVCPKLAVA